MKRIRFAILPLTLWLIAFTASAQMYLPWTISHPFPTGNTLTAVVSSSSGRILLFGEGGTCLRSDNDGATWTSAAYPAGLIRVSAADFPTDQVGYATGDDVHLQGRIAKTTDGGLTWTLLPHINLGYLRDVSFIDADRGWVSGSGGQILRTTNGGAGWTAQTTNLLNDLTAIHMRSATHGLAAANGGTVLETNNGGTSWSLRSTGSSAKLHDVRISYLNTTYVVGPTGHAARRGPDEGSFTKIPLPIRRDLFAILHLSNDATLFCGDSGYVVRSPNGYTEWTVNTTGSDHTWTHISAIDTSRLWMIGTDARLASSSDGGHTWAVRSSGSRGTISDMVTLGGDTAFAVLLGQSILRRTSRQGPWTDVSFGLNTSPRTIVAFDDGSLLVGGSLGRIARSTDGGSTWMAETTESSATIYSLVGRGPIGVAVGAGGSILRSTDRGAQWSPVVSGTTLALYRATFVSDSILVAVGTAGTTVRSTDGGATWTPIHSGQSWTYHGVAFSDTLNGMAVGSALDFGLPPGVVKTTDGGLSWTPALMPSTEPVYPATTVMALRSIAFASDGEGYVVGDEGACYRTTDHGASWSRYLIGTNLSLRDIVQANDGHWIAAGAGGMILESTPVPTHVADDVDSRLHPTSPVLLSAYPNPFNPTTQISFRVAAPSEPRASGASRGGVEGQSAVVRLAVFDLLGREVAVLVNEELPAGSFKVTWQASGFPSGTYYVRLKISHEQAILPIVLIR